MDRSDKDTAVRGVEDEVRALMRRIRDVSRDNAELVHPGLPVSAYRVLTFTWLHEPTRASAIVDELDMDKGAVSRTVTLLQDLGLLERSCDPHDRRALTLRLSPTGRARMSEVIAHRHAQTAQRLSSWTLEELTSFADQLARFNGAVSR